MMSIIAALTAISITLFATYVNITFYCVSFAIMYTLLWWKKRYGKNRFNACYPYAKHPKQTGLLPADSDYQIECPNDWRNEDILLTGVNSSGEVLILQLYWRPTKLVLKCVLGVKLYYRTKSGDTYTCDDIHLTSFSANEYKANGVLLQVLSPFRRLRFRFFGYLRDCATDKLVLTRIKFLWLTTSDVYDYKNDFSLCFAIKQLSQNGIIKILKSLSVEFDDRFEQYGQLKGEVQFGSNSGEKLFLWGIRSKTFVESSGFKTATEMCRNKSITQLIAYTKKGLTLHIGLVDNSFIRYHYGTTLLSSTIHSITSLSTSLDKLQVIFDYEANGLQFVVQFIDEISDNTVFGKVLIDNDDGYCIFVRDVDFNVKYMENVATIENQITEQSNGETIESLVLSLDNNLATYVSLSGCKGSSLATLTKLSNHEINFIIPKGFVVTTNAYTLFLKQNPKLCSDINNLLKYINYPKKLSAKCRKIAKRMLSTTLPEEIQRAIQRKFANCSLLSPYAVRCSPSFDYGKPSTVAIPQTYLGVSGLQHIYCAIIKCWSAQFDPKIIYFRNGYGYGYDVESNIAVIIHEMVDADASGILLTCDPHTGDQRSLLINANYGMMESVVSSLSEPDNIQVVIDIKSNSLWTNERKVSHIGDVKIGSKKKVVKLNPTNNSTEVQVYYGVKKCCINKEMAIKLANIALSIQTYYNYNCTIEWCIKDSKCYILLCRPITCSDSFDDFELTHELDTGMATEISHLSKAGVDDVLPGCVSHLTASYLCFNLFNVHRYRNLIKTEGQPKKYYSPYKQSLVVNQCNQLFVNLVENDFIDWDFKKADNIFAKGIQLSLFGKLVDCAELAEITTKTRCVRNGLFWKIFSILPQLIIPEYCVRKFENRCNEYYSVLNAKNKFQTSHQLIEHICQSFEQMSDMMVYLNCALASELYNSLLIGILNANKKLSESEIMSDYEKILSNCGDIISANVCMEIRDIALSIEDRNRFKQLSDENAILFLLTGNSKSSQLFKAFLAKYGHRGYKELDVMSRVWRMDYNHIIKALKTLTNDETISDEKTSQIVADIRTNLPLPCKFLLNYLALPLCRRALRSKERAKSILVKMIDSHRKAFYMLSDMMASEGRIPDPKLIWHMTLEEIYLLTITHNHNVVNKARQRERLFARIDRWRFNEISVGFDFVPRNIEVYENKLEVHINNNYRERAKYTTLNGTAVTNGKIIGTVFVAQCFEDAANIKVGDILVAYSTDTCWSPYFSIIGGIITEIGGLHSHASITARELNLPAMIAVANACQIMKTGDHVLLDCDKGVITRVANCDNGLINQIVHLDDDID